MLHRQWFCLSLCTALYALSELRDYAASDTLRFDPEFCKIYTNFYLNMYQTRERNFISIPPRHRKNIHG